MPLRFSLACVSLMACSPELTDVSVRLAPEVVSSLDGTLSVQTLVLAGREPAEAERVDLSVDYVDRNGTAHAVVAESGTTDARGLFTTTLAGLTWDGAGTITATVAGGGPTGTARFSVLDRTPPAVTIVAPAAADVRAGRDIVVDVHITDEIGVSQVNFEWSTPFGRSRSSIVASGATDATISFDFQVTDQVGETVTLFALGEDLSGNRAAAQPVNVVVVP